MTCQYLVENPVESWCKDLPIVYRDEEGKAFCVFHAPQGKKGLNLYEFNESVFDLISKSQKEGKACGLSGVIFEGDIHFQRFNKDNPMPELFLYGAVIPGELDFCTRCKGAIGFINTVIQGEGNFANTVFEKGAFFLGVNFKQSVNFNHNVFESVTFTGVKFDSTVSFWGSKFNSEVSFLGCEFNDNASFERVTFSANVTVERTIFKKKTKFLDSHFKRNVSIKRTEFIEMANFKNTTFNGEANFLDTQFKKKVDLSQSTFDQVSYIKGLTFYDIGIMEDLSIRKQLIFEGTSFLKVSFIDTDMRKLDFVNCEWIQKGGWKLLYNEPIALIEQEQSLKKRLMHKVETLYRQLKQKYKEEHNEMEVSNWHYREKEMLRKGAPSVLMRIFLNLYYVASGYGENPSLALLVLVFFITLISFLLMLFGLTPVKSESQLIDSMIVQWPQNVDFTKMFVVFSDVFKYATFQKDYLLQPNSLIGQFIKIFAQIIMPIQTALLALAIRNKFRR